MEKTETKIINEAKTVQKFDTASAASRLTRDTGLDVTRILAFLSVISVHFFIGAEFYKNQVVGEKMYVMTMIRTLSMTCVPLFMLLTGYLTCRKEMELTPKGYIKYVIKLRHVLLTYLFATLVNQAYLKWGEGVQLSAVEVLKNVVGFFGYGWYVEMYIGLYLLIPFFAVLTRSLDKRSLAIFTSVLAVLTVVPSLFNVFDYSSFSSFLSGESKKLFPDWWAKIYPVTYWFIGAYLRKYVDIKKLNTLKITVLLGVSVIVFGIFNIIKSNGETFVWGTHNDWGSFENTVDSVLVFLLVNSVSRKKQLSARKSAFLKLLSEATFGAYLVSYCFDRIMYGALNKVIPMIYDRFVFYPFCVVTVAVLSLAAAIIIRFVVKLCEKCLDKITKRLCGLPVFRNKDKDVAQSF